MALTQQQYNSAKWLGFYSQPKSKRLIPVVEFEGKYYNKSGIEIPSADFSKLIKREV